MGQMRNYILRPLLHQKDETVKVEIKGGPVAAGGTRRDWKFVQLKACSRAEEREWLDHNESGGSRRELEGTF